jgi:hypothetical protein
MSSIRRSLLLLRAGLSRKSFPHRSHLSTVAVSVRSGVRGLALLPAPALGFVVRFFFFFFLSSLF